VPLSLRRLLPLILTPMLPLISTQALADSWTKPTVEELQMTAEPAAPGAAAIYLFHDEEANDKLHVHITYVRLKILTDKGKQYADQEISYDGGQFSIFGVEGRTIHSDGSVIPFAGKPYQKVLSKGGKEQYKATVFTLPDVQVGSILEYRYVLSYDSKLVVSPRWYLQGPLYVRRAHYKFVPSDLSLQDGHGGVIRGRVAYSAFLPPGCSVAYSPAGSDYTIDVEKIPPAPEEEYMPPMHNYTFRALFYYTIAKSADEYWANEGKYWSKNVDKFIDGGKLSSVAAQIVSPSDSPQQKLEKIYGALMKLENTTFTREHTGEEDKAQGIRVKTAIDIWEQKRGNRNDITRLFVGLARDAGFKAYVGFVTNRDRNLFMPAYLSLSQLDDEIAIVEVDGKEQFFDPGERYANYGELHWKHSPTQGIRQTDKGAVVFMTPVTPYQKTVEIRTAYLDLKGDGKVTGTVRISLTGSRALRWRELALSTDEDALKREFENTVQRQMPPGIEVKTAYFIGLTDWDKTLQGVLNVSGSMGTATAKRVFLPATLFAAASHPLFALDKRTMPIDLDYPYMLQDTVTINLPPGVGIESLPKDTEFTFAHNAYYQAKFSRAAASVKSARIFALGNAVYSSEEYPELKDFYQKVNGKDKEPAVLELTQTASGQSVTLGSVAAGKVE
jgi:Domain of Unknown Function with PDB structure (DUF3857)